MYFDHYGFMAATCEMNKSQSSGDSFNYKRKIFIEDLTDNDQTDDLSKYLSTFGVLRSCNINKAVNAIHVGLKCEKR